MKYILMVLLYLSVPSSTEWMTDMQKAMTVAREQQKLILLNFSGSDWCAPCVRLKKEIFQSPEFSETTTALVLVNADFPRSKKNQLSKEQQQLNDGLADKYNPEGKFPFTILMDAQGKVLYTWEGFPSSGKDRFLEDLKTFSLKHAPAHP